MTTVTPPSTERAQPSEDRDQGHDVVTPSVTSENGAGKPNTGGSDPAVTPVTASDGAEWNLDLIDEEEDLPRFKDAEELARHLEKLHPFYKPSAHKSAPLEEAGLQEDEADPGVDF